MKNNVKFLLPFVFLFVSVSAYAATDYAKLWKRADAYEQKGLPRSVIAVADSAAKFAVAEKQYDQQLKALIYKAKAEFDLDAATATESIAGIAAFARSCPDKTVAAIAYAHTARFYSQLLDSFGYKLPSTVLDGDSKGLSPEQWSVEMFRDTIEKYADLSLANAELTSKTAVASYISLLESGKDCNLRPSVYNVLVHNAIDLCTEEDDERTLKLYEDLEKAEADKPDAAAMTALEKAVFQGSDLDKFVSDNYDKDIVVYAFYLNASAMEDKKAAAALCNTVLSAYKGNHYLPFIEYLLTSLERPYVRATADSYCIKGERVSLELEYRNVSSATLEVYRIDMTPQEYADYRYKEIPEKYLKKTATFNYPLDFTDATAQNDTTVHFDLPDYGIYRYKLSVADKGQKPVSLGDVCVTDLKLMWQSRAGVLNCMVLNAKDGKAVQGAEISLGYEGKTVATAVSGKDGSASFKSLSTAKAYRAQVSKGPDAFCMPQRVSVYRVSQVPDTERKIAIFTDRKVYRPGQTVWYKAVVYDEGMDSKSVICEEKLDVSISNSNRVEVDRSSAVTNDFGSIAGSFVLPAESVTGNYTLTIGSSRAYFEVQNYQRAGFEVIIDPIEGTYTWGDTVEVNVRLQSYSGTPVAYGSLAVGAVGRPLLWRTYFGGRIAKEQTLLFADTLTADGEGKACFSLPLRGHGAGVCEITVAATGASGETRVGKTNLTVNQSPFAIRLNVEPIAVKECGLSFTADCRNLAGTKLDLPLHYSVIQGADTLLSSASDESCQIPADKLKALPDGRYTLMVCAKDSKGRKVEESRSFVLSSCNASVPPVDTLLWLEKAVVNDNELSFKVGSSRKTNIVCNLYSTTGLVSQKTVSVDNRIKTCTFKRESWYPSHLRFEAIAIADGKVDKQYVDITPENTDNDLSLEITTFRDVVEPGTIEEWKIKVLDKDGNPVEAEVAVSMYDIALDQMAPNAWTWNMGRHFGSYFPRWNWAYGNVSNSIYYKDYVKQSYIFDFPKIRDFGLSFAFARVYDTMLKSANIRGQVTATEEAAMADMAAPAAGASEAANEEPLRESFAETAFFLPQIATDSAGVASFMFTTPADITTWKLLAVAHTRDMAAGLSSDTIVSRKYLSAIQKLPRFVREGDSVCISVELQNLLEQNVNAKFSYKIYSISGEPFTQTASKPVSLEAGGQSVFGIDIQVPKGVSNLAIETRLEGAGYSDGERRYLRVLPQTMPLVESMRMDMPKSGNYAYGFGAFKDKLTGEAVEKGVVVEFCSNPAWAAVLALPEIGKANSENAVDMAAAIYANAQLVKIFSENVAYRNFLRVCEQLPKNPQLYGNETTDAVRIQDPVMSPWQQKTTELSSLPELLDKAKAAGLQDYYAARLRELQLPSGAFAWFKGGYANLWVSLQVADALQGMAQYSDMYDKLCAYFADVLKEGVKDKTGVGSSHLRMLLHYKGTKDNVYDYYVSKIKENFGKTGLETKALLARVAHKFSDDETEKLAMASLREYATRKDGAMFWPNADEVESHIEIMQAFKETSGQNDEFMEQVYWLLQHKRSNIWDNALVTAKAAKLLAGDGAQSLFDEEGEVQATVGGVPMQGTENVMPGYFAKYYAPGEIDFAKDSIEIVNTARFAWGAAWLVYDAPVSEVKASATALKIDKKLLRVLPDGTAREIKAGEALAKGDRVRVRLLLDVPAEADFVCLKDSRAAGMEPAELKSAYKSQGGLRYYMDIKDEVCDFYFDHLSKGKYVLEYDLFAGIEGKLSSGPAQIQSLYEPAINANSQSTSLMIEN